MGSLCAAQGLAGWRRDGNTGWSIEASIDQPLSEWEEHDRAGIPDFRFHDMRHTFATRLVQRGVDLYKVQRLLGHKTSMMTQHYALHSPESLREGVNVLDEPQPQRVSTNLAQEAILSGVARVATLGSD